VAVVVAAGWWWRGNGGDVPPPATATQSVEQQQTPSAADANSDIRWPTPGLGGGLSPDTDASPTPAPADSADASTPTSAVDPEPTSPPTQSLLETAVTTVSVQAGQTLVDIAAEFDLDVRTLLWANEISDPNVYLAKDTEVIVPKQDGVVHEVATGDTLEEIAALYGVEPQAIIHQNGMQVASDADLETGDLLLAAGGVLADRGRVDGYIVRDDDTLWQIAGYYGLDPAVLLWANDLPRAELIYPDQELLIPPGNGALVVVQAGETVDSLAARFEVEPAAIRAYGFNGLGANGEPGEGEMVLVPGSILPPLADGPSELTAETVAGEGVVGPATGLFLWPTEGWITQQFHESHNGVDIANEEWTPVNATDGGIVIFAGWNDYGLGFAVGIDHGNGFQTWYGHLANEPYVEVGQVIWQGGYLGPMGTTGKSTGPHLHFIVIKDGVYQNPLDYLE
jgi:murein DD-endopeptidase MepM/ murein hydrolase activator NlpD